MIKLTRVEKQYADKLLFSNVNITIEDGEHIGIVGANGSGKTTLLKIMGDEETLDAGNSFCDCDFGYLKQISEYTNCDFSNICSNAEFARNFLQTTSKLGLDRNIDFSAKRLENISGGEKTKLMLAHILSQNPKCLLLDEPTNHLDETGIEWLKEMIRNFNGTVVAISHDRDFLNSFADKIIEIENGKVSEFYGNYNEYFRQKQQHLMTLKRNYEKQKATEHKINK